MSDSKPQETRFLPPGPGGDEGGNRAPGSRWPGDEWGDEDYWKQTPAGGMDGVGKEAKEAKK